MIAPAWLETDARQGHARDVRDQLDADDRRRRGEPGRLPHRLPRRPRRHPGGHRRPAADRRRDPGVRRRRRALRAADVVVGGGHKWLRAGWGTGFLAFGDRALERLAPVCRGSPRTDVEGTAGRRGAPADPRRRAAFPVSHPDPIGAGAPRRGARGDRGVGVERDRRRARRAGQRRHRLRRPYAVPVDSPPREPERAGHRRRSSRAAGSLTALAASLPTTGSPSPCARGTRAARARTSAPAPRPSRMLRRRAGRVLVRARVVTLAVLRNSPARNIRQRVGRTRVARRGRSVESSGRRPVGSATGSRLVTHWSTP